MLGLILSIALVGLLVWAITTLIPMPEPFKRAIYVIAVVVLVLYLVSFFGSAFDVELFPTRWRRVR